MLPLKYTCTVIFQIFRIKHSLLYSMQLWGVLAKRPTQKKSGNYWRCSVTQCEQGFENEHGWVLSLSKISGLSISKQCIFQYL